MSQCFECFDCHRVVPIEAPTEKCPSCGSTNGQAISAERCKEGFEAGVFFNIDPKTGKPAKKRR